MTTTTPAFYAESPAPRVPAAVLRSPSRTSRRGSHARPGLVSGLPSLRLLPLAVILLVQSGLSLVLARSNSAFLDEAVYLGAGHQLLHTWLHGGPALEYPTYFSGAPVIYPVLGALADAAGGLLAARLFSLLCMLAATILVYASGRRLYGTAAGLLAAATFSTVEGTLFLGSLATFDAMSLALVALAAWIVIRTASAGGPEPHPLFYLAAPVLVLANATKYASTLYDIVVIALAFLVMTAHHGRARAVKAVVILTALTAGLVSTLLALAGPSYGQGITSTTLARAAGTSSMASVVHDAVSWIGVLTALAIVATVSLLVGAARRRVGWPAAAIAVVLAGATLLAPLNQARIHTVISLNKHVDFGAWFGAILVGWFLSRLAGADWRQAWRWLAVGCLLLPLAVIGWRQATNQFHQWPDSEPLVRTLAPMVEHRPGAILIDEAQVPAYYLGDTVSATRWFNTFYLRYTPPDSTVTLTGRGAYVSAIDHDAFAVVALNFGAEGAIDRAVARAIGGNPAYVEVATVPLHDADGTSTYVIWRRKGA